MVAFPTPAMADDVCNLRERLCEYVNFVNFPSVCPSLSPTRREAFNPEKVMQQLVYMMDEILGHIDSRQG